MFSFFRRRDVKVYPKDEIGDALYERAPDPANLPDKLALWYDAYFESEKDANSVASHLDQRRIDVVRDHDDEPDQGFGAWNVDFELPVPARHLDLKLAHGEALRLIADNHGKLSSWLLVSWDDDEAS